MKNLGPLQGWPLAVAFIFICGFIAAQTPQLTKEQWENAKQQGQLDGKAATYIHADALPVVTRIAPNVPVNPASTSCSCWQQRDASFSVAPFTIGLPPAYRNDDGSTNVIALPFNFCLYGQSWSTCYINNNGNVSFGMPYGTFTASGFPNAAFEMVAPFWADVDTRNTGSGLVYYKITPTYMIVQWDSVGYYNSHTNLVNTFQLIITDGSDPIVPNGNVSFCYKDMQWTTGDASSGVGGFNGSDAIVGANRGDGVNYIQFGSFNQPGGNYNGPSGSNSGIDWLDNQSFIFDACTNSNNIPPTISGINPCDTFRVCENDTFHLDPEFFSPEVGQITTITVSAPGVNGYTIVSNTSGNTAQLISYLVGQASNLGYNTITITATDNGTPNASTVVTVVIEVTPSPTATATSVATTCGGNNGSANVVASGGSGTYTYSWSPSGGNAPSATGLSAGNYTCTITDAASGCSVYQAVTIGGSTNVSLTNTFSNISCNGGSNGSATVNATGGSGVYSYSWTPSGGNAATATGLSAGSYTATVTDSNGCVASQIFTLTQPSALSAAATSQTDVSCNGGSNGSATVSAAGGTPGYSYSWAPSGGNAATATGLAAGNYTCTVTDANSCSTTQTFSITAPPLLTFTISVTPTQCNGSTATANVSGGTSPYNYVWSNFTFSQTATNLNPGNVTCTVTDANGCTASQSVTITTAPLLTAISSWTSVFCYGDSTGNAGVTANGGTPGYTYSWAPYGGTASSATGLAAGTYTCTITDANGCTLNRSFTLTQPTQVVSSSTQTNNSCFGDANGTATVTSSGGVPNYTYAWAPSGGNTATATGLAAGIYTCTITDANGCNSTLSVTVTQPTQITCSVSVVNATCNAQGSATASPSGGVSPYTYSWSSGGTNATENNLNAGTYTVTVTDANGCVMTQTATISIASTISATSTSTNISCFGNSTGTASVTASGGTTPYTYSWSPTGGTNATATGLAAGNYTCTITDANGCQSTQTVTITAPSQLTATSSHTDVQCNGQSNGSATVTPAGGTPAYTYAWSPSGGTNSSAIGLTSGAYTCTIADANGCVTTQTVSVTQPAPLTVSAPNNAICPDTPGQISATVSGGTGPYTYSWSNGPATATQTITISANTSYTVTVTDANGCSSTSISSVTLNPVPSASITTSAIDGIYIISPSTQLCYYGSTAGITAWYWSINGDTSTAPNPCVTVTPADTGIFCSNLIVVNSYGCVDTAYNCVEVKDVFFNIPNVFTPNGDGVNDVFQITNNGMKSFHCQVYDRWGVFIYDWYSPTGYWDGKTKSGNDAVDGVYYWTLDMMDFSGVTYQNHGFVHLVRGK